MKSGLSITLGLLAAGCGTSFLPAREYDGATAVFRANTAVVLLSASDDVWIDVPDRVTVVCGGPGVADPNKAPVGKVCKKSSVVELSVKDGKIADFVLCLDDCEGAEDILRGRIEPADLVEDKKNVCLAAAPAVPADPKTDPSPTPAPLRIVHAGYVLAHGHVVDEGMEPLALVTTRKLEAAEMLFVEPIVGGVKVTCAGQDAPAPSERATCRGEGVLLAPDRVAPAGAGGTPSVLVCARASTGEGTCATVLFREKKSAGAKGT